MNDLVVSEQQRDLFHMAPKQKVAFATEVANVLKDVIVQQKLTVRIGPNEHVKAEGWATLGTLLGILPVERSVTEHKNGDFEAAVDLVRQSDGVRVGGASALCSVDEKRWSSAERYARRSMAVTRATGKAYRLSFAWIMTLAGYNPTPFEEMPDVTPDDGPHPAGKTKAKDDTKDGQPKSSGFNTQDETHLKWLATQLRARKINEKWDDAIANTLSGRPASALSQVVKEVVT